MPLRITDLCVVGPQPNNKAQSRRLPKNQATADRYNTVEDGRGERIRTPGLRYPKPSRYQTALRPDMAFPNRILRD